MLRNYCTSTEVGAGARRAAPADADLAVVAIPTHVRDVTARVTRTVAERNVFEVQMLLGLPEVEEFVEEALKERNPSDFLLGKFVGREVFQLLISFDPAVPDPNCIVLRGRPIVYSHGGVEVFGIAPAFELALADPIDLIKGQSLLDDDELAEACLHRRNLRIAHERLRILEAEVSSVELLPLADLATEVFLEWHRSEWITVIEKRLHVVSIKTPIADLAKEFTELWSRYSRPRYEYFSTHMFVFPLLILFSNSVEFG